MSAVASMADRALLEQVDYVIPIRVSDPSRQRNVTAVVQWVRTHLRGVGIVIVEQDASVKLRLPKVAPPDLRAGGIEHVFLPDGGPFDKGWALNCGARKAGRPFIAFGDADVAVAPAQFLAALRLLTRCDAVKPYHRALVIDLDTDESECFAKSAQVGGLTGVNRRGMTNFAGGMFLMRREAFLEIGGFPEGFCGWGGEDDAMGIVIERLTRHAEVSGPCVHLAHPPLQALEDPLYLRNVQRLIEVARASNTQLRKWGLARRLTMGKTHRPPDERWHAIPAEGA